jgi:hypothetical protein
MAHPFCEHLDQYGVQYTRTEASYRQCVNLLERLMNGGPSPELVPLVTSALQEWSYEDQKLREMLVNEVRDGRVLVPSGIVPREGAAAIRLRRRAKKSSHPVCATCRFAVPRLEYPEWQFAHNGQVSFRGQDLVLPATTPV